MLYGIPRKSFSSRSFISGFDGADMTWRERLPTALALDARGVRALWGLAAGTERAGKAESAEAAGADGYVRGEKRCRGTMGS
ncbi:hypothetical protein J2X42_001884 [Arthrobacter sp. BE255]|nr:hypothetical protein [Arthrobacter sp. BE255]